MALTDLNYAYDVDGQLTAIVDNLDPSKSKAISYDQLNRLVQVAEGIPVSQGGVPIPVEDYAYDQEGNRTASHLSALYSSNDHNQLLEDDTYTYAYDAKGNRVSRTEKATGDVETYTYDSQNRLIGYASPTVTASYAYDALDRRVAKTIETSTDSFVYNAWSRSSVANNVSLDFQAGVLSRRWLHGQTVDEQLTYERYSGTTTAGTGSVFELLRDRIGSVILAVSVATGSVAAEYDYDSFGSRLEIHGAEEVRYGFTGREHDTESGLIYFRARHYDPQIGQFIQDDPIGFAGGDFNLYAYTWNDPVNWTDPSGLAVGGDAAVNSAKAGLGAGVVGVIGGGLRNFIKNFLLALLAADAVFSTSDSGNPPDESTDTQDPPGPIGDNNCDPLTDDNCQCGPSGPKPDAPTWQELFLKALELVLGVTDAVDNTINNDAATLADAPRPFEERKLTQKEMEELNQTVDEQYENAHDGSNDDCA